MNEIERVKDLMTEAGSVDPTVGSGTLSPHLPPVDAAALAAVIRGLSRNSKLVVVSNREPVIHEARDDGVREIRPASGMITGIEPIVRAVSGTWVAHGSGSADRRAVDTNDRFTVSGGRSSYALRRVWLTRQEEQGYYYGVANSALWPLCHIVYARPQFSRRQWETYRRVNEKFCAAVLEEIGSEDAIVFIQDYHLALLPRLLRQARPDLTIVMFWHIPWPNPEAFRIMPWGEELLDGLLGSDLLGFHIQYHCNNFLDTVDHRVEARIDREQFSVFRGGTPTYVRPFPISVDFEQVIDDAVSVPVRHRVEEILAAIEHDGRQQLLVGVDRLDYTKGIIERLRAVDRLLLEYPELRGRVTLLQLAAPSRTHVEAYRRLGQEMDALVDDINWRHQDDTWQPIRLLRGHHDYTTVMAAYQVARVLLVTSLHDGMNLVAKEFVAARRDEDGVLLLSKYTGAARELADAVQVNPFDIDAMTQALYGALTMEAAERRERMVRMRELVRTHNVYEWGIKIFTELQAIQPLVRAARRGGGA